MADKKKNVPIAGKGSGLRRRFHGRRSRPDGSLRSHHTQGTVRAAAGWTTGDTARQPIDIKRTLGAFKVPAPTKRWQRKGIVRNATTGEQVS
jgi:hypothetical protein